MSQEAYTQHETRNTEHDNTSGLWYNESIGTVLYSPTAA